VKTTGDGFLAMFDGPGRAVTCATEITEAVGGLGIDIRVGLHTGEGELRDSDLGGIGVHIAQRVMAAALTGRIFVSRTVKDLVVGSGIEIQLRHPTKPYWWSTRLFLIAALAQDYSRVHAFVFVDGEEDRHFLGLATPTNVRLGLGGRFPSLGDVYELLRAGVDQSMPATQQVEHMIKRWSMSTFAQDGKPVTEEDFKVGVNRLSLSLSGRTEQAAWTIGAFGGRGSRIEPCWRRSSVTTVRMSRSLSTGTSIRSSVDRR
jgi:hypothetical protein